MLRPYSRPLLQFAHGFSRSLFPKQNGHEKKTSRPFYFRYDAAYFFGRDSGGTKPLIR